MAYNKDTQTITAPVTMRDVQQVLGTGVNTLSGLCTHTSINMWSKKKPVRLNRMFTADVADWWKGDAKDCGIEIPYTEDVNRVVDLKWSYKPPTGGTSSPYRLTDFVGYCHKAVPFISFASGDYIVDKINTKNISINAVINDMDDFTAGSSIADSVGAGDIATIADYYFCLVLDNGSSKKAVTSSKPIKMGSKINGGGGVLLNLDLPPFGTADNQTIKAVPCICSNIQLQGDGTKISKYYPLPTSSEFNIKIINSKGMSANFGSFASSLRGQYSSSIMDEFFKTTGGLVCQCIINSNYDTTFNANVVIMGNSFSSNTMSRAQWLLYDENFNRISDYSLQVRANVPRTVYYDLQNLIAYNGQYIKGKTFSFNMQVYEDSSMSKVIGGRFFMIEGI